MNVPPSDIIAFVELPDFVRQGGLQNKPRARGWCGECRKWKQSIFIEYSGRIYCLDCGPLRRQCQRCGRMQSIAEFEVTRKGANRGVDPVCDTCRREMSGSTRPSIAERFGCY